MTVLSVFLFVFFFQIQIVIKSLISLNNSINYKFSVRETKHSNQQLYTKTNYYLLLKLKLILNTTTRLYLAPLALLLLFPPSSLLYFRTRKGPMTLKSTQFRIRFYDSDRQTLSPDWLIPANHRHTNKDQSQIKTYSHKYRLWQWNAYILQI
jgi:hypothetical protein